MKFAEREERRGNRYDIILLDPPAYGRGPKGEVWQLFEDLPALIDLCRAILTPKPLAVVLTAYSIRASFFAIHALMRDTFAGLGGTVESGELVLREKSAGRALVDLAVFALGGGMSSRGPPARRARSRRSPASPTRWSRTSGAGAEEIPRPAERLHGRRAEAGHRRARSRLDDPDAGLRQVGAGNAAVEQVGRAHRRRRRRGARSVSEKVLAAITRRDNPQMVVGVFAQQTACRSRTIRADGRRRLGRRSTACATPAISAPSSAPSMRSAPRASSWSARPPTRSPPETVRATMGSIFAVPVARATPDAFLAWRQELSAASSPARISRARSTTARSTMPDGRCFC